MTCQDRTALQGVRVLCVAPHASTRTLLGTQLRAWGMQVDALADGPQALEHLRAAARNARPYAVALLDAQLPGMEGLAVARAVTADPALAAVRLILLTPVGERGRSGEAQQAGCAASLRKPIRHAQLYDCLTMVLGTAAPSAATRLASRHVLRERLAQGYARVLVAEDNPVNQKVAVRLLEKLGCRVDVVGNGLEAVEAAGRIAYNGIFMDCQMPEMDGYAATVAIRQREMSTVQHTPIIAMTANALQGDRERCLAAGMNDYISKPVQVEALEAVLRRWVHPRVTPAEPPVPPSAVSPAPGAPGARDERPALDAEACTALQALCQDDDTGMSSTWSSWSTARHR
jgi:CheY-like chemotaxis protein